MQVDRHVERFGARQDRLITAIVEKLAVREPVDQGAAETELAHRTFELVGGGLPGLSGFRLATAAWGWHSETAIHVLRLVVAGTLDRHPKLKLIIGHMGEGLAAMLVRSDKALSDEVKHLSRSVAQTIRDQVWVTTSGLFTQPPLDVLLAVFGSDRVMFSIDYPYSSNRTGRDYLDKVEMPAADFEKFAHGNADRLLKLKVPAKK